MKAQVNFDALGGGGSDTDIVTAYENGEWKNGFSISDFITYGLTAQSDYMENDGTQGSGMNLITDYSNEYSDILIKFTTTNTETGRAIQAGWSNLTNASMPTIITNGWGRGSKYGQYYFFFPSYQMLGFPLTNSGVATGAYFGVSSYGAVYFKIHGIYFVKN